MGTQKRIIVAGVGLALLTSLLSPAQGSQASVAPNPAKAMLINASRGSATAETSHIRLIKNKCVKRGNKICCKQHGHFKCRRLKSKKSKDGCSRHGDRVCCTQRGRTTCYNVSRGTPPQPNPNPVKTPTWYCLGPKQTNNPNCHR
jgi:hypothetical protein